MRIAGCLQDIYGWVIEYYTQLVMLNFIIRLYIASEALREYGWNGHEKNIKCSDEMKEAMTGKLIDFKGFRT